MQKEDILQCNVGDELVGSDYIPSCAYIRFVRSFLTYPGTSTVHLYDSKAQIGYLVFLGGGLAFTTILIYVVLCIHAKLLHASLQLQNLNEEHRKQEISMVIQSAVITGVQTLYTIDYIWTTTAAQTAYYQCGL